MATRKIAITKDGQTTEWTPDGYGFAKVTNRTTGQTGRANVANIRAMGKLSIDDRDALIRMITEGGEGMR